MGQAAPVIVAVVAVVATVYAGPAVGEAIYGALGTTEAATGVSAATVGAAAIGGSTSAVNAAVEGKNLEGVLKAGAIGAASGAVGSEVSQGISGQVGYDLPADQAGPVQAAKGVAGELGSQAAGNIAGKAAGGAASQFAGSELSGSNLQQASRQAAIGGATGALTGSAQELAGYAGVPSDITRATLSAAGPYIRQDVSSLFGGAQGATGGGGTTSQPVPSYLTSGPAGTGGSALLGSSIGGGGTDISPPVQLGSEPTTSRNAWVNQASLREGDQSGGVA
jgi:hypothetical protein